MMEEDVREGTTEDAEFYVIRVGVLDKDSHQNFQWQIDRHGELITTPPRMNSLWLEQQSFRNLV